MAISMYTCEHLHILYSIMYSPDSQFSWPDTELSKNIKLGHEVLLMGNVLEIKWDLWVKVSVLPSMC